MYNGGHLQTRESFLYGRFECSMMPSFGSGIISSFFTFFDGANFSKNWNEIDFEFLGRHTNNINTNAIKTVNGFTDKNTNVRQITLNNRSSDLFWKLCIDWTPGRIVWKINDIVIRTANIDLKSPQKLMMNTWIGTSAWTGEFNSNLLPKTTLYEYVQYSAYKNDTFVFKWRDEFEKLDLTRWYIAEHIMDGTQFTKENVFLSGNKLCLLLS